MTLWKFGCSLSKIEWIFWAFLSLCLFFQWWLSLGDLADDYGVFLWVLTYFHQKSLEILGVGVRFPGVIKLGWSCGSLRGSVSSPLGYLGVTSIRMPSTPIIIIATSLENVTRKADSSPRFRFFGRKGLPIWGYTPPLQKFRTAL